MSLVVVHAPKNSDLNVYVSKNSENLMTILGWVVGVGASYHI